MISRFITSWSFLEGAVGQVWEKSVCSLWSRRSGPRPGTKGQREGECKERNLADCLERLNSVNGQTRRVRQIKIYVEPRLG